MNSVFFILQEYKFPSDRLAVTVSTHSVFAQHSMWFVCPACLACLLNMQWFDKAAVAQVFVLKKQLQGGGLGI